jgi:hypothetical protein
MYLAVLPLAGVIALIRRQFWSSAAQARWLGGKKYFWFYVLLFGGLAASTVFTVAARSVILLSSVGGDLTWPIVGVPGVLGGQTIFAVSVTTGFVASALFYLAARQMHVGGENSDSIYTIMSNWHLGTYVAAFLLFSCELVCDALLCYGVYKTFLNTIPFWFAFPLPVFFLGFVILCIAHRIYPTKGQKI